MKKYVEKKIRKNKIFMQNIVLDKKQSILYKCIALFEIVLIFFIEIK